MITGNAEVLKDLSRIVGDTATHIVINASSKLENINVINIVWTMVMDKVMGMIDKVMTESIDSDRCDDGDGKKQKSAESKVNVETETEYNTNLKGQEKEEKILDKVSKQVDCTSCLRSSIL
ncbi:MAG: hypothetical protein HC764_17750 [Pleurocapsa sp. CRU_1_2]|nr:hypothetical protein [Pleurocapsa sp. CRU_1_2]